MTTPTRIGNSIRPGSEPIPGYHIVARLGAGQFGEVWSARSPGDAQVALKFLPMGGTHGWKEFRAVQRVKQIRHPNLMPIIAIWLLDEDGEVISDDVLPTLDVKIDETAGGKSNMDTLVIEPVRQSRRPAQMVIANLLADQTLGDRLRECQAKGLPGIPEKELLRYMEEAAKGLDFLNSSLHQIGDSQGSVQHCDVKPDNIMLTGGSAIVSDFGVAQMMAEVKTGVTATSLGGTPAYMAPECFQSKTSPGTDQYALAVTYYELRTGKLPFDHQTYAAVYEAHKSGTLDFSSVSQRERAVLKKATSPDPERRYPSCLDFVLALKGAEGPAAPPSRRRLRAVVSVAALLTAAAAGTTLFSLYWEWDSTNRSVAGVEKVVKSGNYESAAILIQEFQRPKDIGAALQVVIKQLEADQPAKQLELEPLQGLIQLLSRLRSLPPKRTDQFLESQLKDLGEYVDKQLNVRMQAIRDQLRLWTPEKDPQSQLAVVSPKISELSEILETRHSAAGPRLDECELYVATLKVHSARAEARADVSKWPDLLEELPSEVHETIEQNYAAALRFILASGRDSAGMYAAHQSEAKVVERLRAYLQLRGEIREFALDQWEQLQIDSELSSLDNAIVAKPTWLNLEAFTSLIRQFKPAQLPRSSEAARDPIRFQLLSVSDRRRRGNFELAREMLGKVPEDAAPEAKELAADERFLITLLDVSRPATEVNQLLAEADFARWQRLNREMKSADSTRAALIELMNVEAALRLGNDPDGAAKKSSNELREQIKGLAFTDFEPYAPYAQYVLALSFARDARSARAEQQGLHWEDASKAIEKAYQASIPRSPLRTSERIQSARSILSDALHCWSGGDVPTDADYGRSDIFGQWSRQAYDNLLLARQQLQWIRDDVFLCAALAAWDSLSPAERAQLGSIAEKSLKQGKSGSGLIGTIYCVQCKAQQVAGASPAAQLHTGAEALKHLYLAGGAEPRSDLTPEQLKRLYGDVVQPLESTANELWSQYEQNPGAVADVAGLAVFYRAAGFLMRDVEVAQDVRIYRSDNPDALAFKYLSCANLLQPQAAALVLQGRSLSDVHAMYPDWRERLSQIAALAVKASASQPAAPVHARALALQSYATLMLARDDRRPMQQRLQDFSSALAQIEKAIALQAAADQKVSEYAEWLGNRSTISIEMAKHGNLSATDRKRMLESARDHAKEAAGLEIRANGHFPYLAWGNALEDLAFYLNINPETNYEEACEKFQKAVEMTSHETVVSLEYADHLSSLLSLIRCRARWVDSGALSRVEEENKLRQSLKDVTDSLPSLDPKDHEKQPLSAGATRKIAELLLWRSETSWRLADRLPKAERMQEAASAVQDLEWAVQWAAMHKAWEPWAEYQRALAVRHNALGNAEEAARICQEILSLEREHAVGLPSLTICRTIRALQGYNAALKKSWTPSDWDLWIARFPLSDSANRYYHAFLQVSRVSSLASPTEADLEAVANLVESLQVDELQSHDELGLKLKWIEFRADRAMKLASQAMTNVQASPTVELKDQWRREGIRQCQSHSDYREEALALRDNACIEPVKEAINQLQAGQTWNKLSLVDWQRRILADHLRSTFDDRQKLITTNMTLLRTPVAKVPELNRDLLRETTKKQIRLLSNDIIKDYKPPTWDREIKIVLEDLASQSTQ